MVEVKCNFEFGKTGLKCSLGCDNVEDQKHLFDCPELKDEEENDKEVLSYEEIYGNDLDKVRRVTQRLMERFKKFTTMVNRQTKPCSATTVNNIEDDNIVNRSDVSVVDLDL